MATAAAAHPGRGPALEDLFDDDMDVDVKMDVQMQRAMAAYDDPWADLKNPHVMQHYYRRLLPWKPLFHWLNHDHTPTKTFTHREFAFTLQNDAYLRYNSYPTWQDLQRDVMRLNPARFEIGPVYSFRPKDRKSLSKAAFKPIQRELVFDIDMTDYDEIRACCSDKSICQRCWRFIAMAVKVLDKSLREDFGFKWLLWVYSGRRGIHCWISDPEAMKLSDDERRSLVSYLEVVKGGAQTAKKVELGRRPLHPSLERSLESLKIGFTRTVLMDQDAFQEREKWEKLLQAIPDRETVNALTSKWEEPAKSRKGSDLTSSQQRWDDFLSIIKSQSDKVRRTALVNAASDLVLQYTYPRIDVEVSRHLNHLLKSPFVVHPGTGKVCVPLDPEKVDEFDLGAVPDVRDLLRELDRLEVEAKQKGEAVDTADPAWEKTRLKPYVELFERHCQSILKGAVQAKREKAGESLEF